MQSLMSALRGQSTFSGFIIGLLLISYLIYPVPVFAAWFGFFVAAYSAIANDSIQTIGTFIASNKQRPWWHLWVYLGLIFFMTVLYSWLTYGGDVSHERLIAKGFEQTPTRFSHLQIIAPIVLLVLTRAKMPVSTTFLLLGSFAATSKAIAKVLIKSLSGYFLAFGIALVFFCLVAKISKKYFVGQPTTSWVIAQWITSGLLWSVWLQQDLANVAVFLPRSLSLTEFTLFSTYIVLGLGLLLYFRGGRIQVIVTEKSEVFDPRFVTLIDGVYALILYYFKIKSKIPMSTTWVFLGLLAGRELGMYLRSTSRYALWPTLGMSSKDAAKAIFGLLVSILIATSVNSSITVSEIQGFLWKALF